MGQLKIKNNRRTPQILLGVNLPKSLYKNLKAFMFSKKEYSLSKVFRDRVKEIFESPEISREFMKFFEKYEEPKKVETKFAMLVLDEETKKILDDKLITLRVRAKSKLVRALIKFFIQKAETKIRCPLCGFVCSVKSGGIKEYNFVHFWWEFKDYGNGNVHYVAQMEQETVGAYVKCDKCGGKVLGRLPEFIFKGEV